MLSVTLEGAPGDVPSGAFPLALLAVPEYFSVTTGATLNLEGRTQDGPTVEYGLHWQFFVTAAKRSQGEK